MKRQARGSGSTVIANTSARKQTVQDTADGGERGRVSQLRRRLGRADLRAVPETRRALRELLRHWGRPGQSETAELLTSELVTNALVHTDQDAYLTATVGPDCLRVEVRDFVAGRPQPRRPDTGDATHGRGLALVQSLADAWGVRPHATGKAVWFELGAEMA
ncbi:ATP-binding protein [Streptomyces phaeoluteigriseus]|uniref:ATP-binding protein n=1 Tax=Streptomyces phaeoluteigriseus TaxID=114686 RepID=UPI003EB906F5